MPGLVDKVVTGNFLVDKANTFGTDIPKAASTAPTKAEFDALVDRVNAIVAACGLKTSKLS